MNARMPDAIFSNTAYAKVKLQWGQGPLLIQLLPMVKFGLPLEIRKHTNLINFVNNNNNSFNYNNDNNDNNNNNNNNSNNNNNNNK